MEIGIEALYKEYYERMLLTARTLLGNGEEARDVVSDVFAELLARGKTLDGEQAEHYLQVSVRHRCLNLLDHRRVVKDSEQSLTQEQETADYEEPPLEQVLDYMDTQLTTKTSRVMRQRFLEEKKYNEIADDMGISRVAVFKHLSRGIHQLQSHFAWYHALLLLLLVSGLAYAILLHTRQPAPRPAAQPVAVEQTAPPTASPEVVHYEEATLETILTDIARYHHADLHFLSDDARALRLFYDWHQADALTDIVQTLDAFEGISIEYRQNTLFVE